MALTDRAIRTSDDLVVADLREDELLTQAQIVVSAPVKPAPRHALEILDAGQGQGDQTVQELPHTRPPQGDRTGHGHPLAHLEPGDGLLGALEKGLLPRDRTKLGDRGVHELDIQLGVAHPDVHHDLLDPGELHHVPVPELLLQGGSDLRLVLLLETSEIIDKVMETFNSQNRYIFRERFIYNRSQADIAKTLGVSQMTISRAERNIVEQFRAELHRE